MVLADPQGWDRCRAAKWMTVRRWLEKTLTMSLRRFERNDGSPKRHVTGRREYFGWGVFALIAR